MNKMNQKKPKVSYYEKLTARIEELLNIHPGKRIVFCASTLKLIVASHKDEEIQKALAAGPATHQRMIIGGDPQETMILSATCQRAV